jgi:hypothetical protein
MLHAWRGGRRQNLNRPDFPRGSFSKEDGVVGKQSKVSEVRERAVRLGSQQEAAHGWEWSAITSIAQKIG